jgi:hypothetical protein
VFVSVSIRLRANVRQWLTPALLALALLALVPAAAIAGGSKYIAGTSFFNPGVLGQPVHWAGGQLNYYVDQGPLNAWVSNQQATTMVDAAAAAPCKQTFNALKTTT